MTRSFNVLIRILGVGLVVVAVAVFFRALLSVDRREFVGSLLAIIVGWLCLSAGVEFLRRDSAE
jgi:hypothetical protein